VSLRDRLSGLLSSSTDSETTGDQTPDSLASRPLVADIDVAVPDDVPGECPNCGAPFDPNRDLRPPPSQLDEPVRMGEHTHLCHIGSASDTPLAGWQVIHR